MLDKAVEWIQEAELTGAPADRAGRSAAAVRNYNATLRHVTASGLAPAALFAPLPDDANLTDVGISSAQLAEYLRAGLPEPLQEAHKGPTLNRNLIVGNLNLGAGEDKDELGRMVREYLTEHLGEARPGATAGQPSEGAQPAQSQPADTSAASSAGGAAASASRRALPSQQARVEELQSEPQAQARR